MSILDSFFILFESDTSKLDKGLSESDKKATGFLDKLKQVDKVASSTGGNFLGLINKLAGVAGVTLSLGALVAGVRSTVAEYKALEMLALQFRSTVEAVDDFRDAAGLLGISEEKSTESLHGLERAMQDTAMGMGRAQKVFEELHISVKDGHGHLKATTQVMGELADKFKTMDKGKQIRVMERLDLDPALLKLFNADLGALQRRMAEVDRATGFDLDTAVKRAGEYTKISRELGVELKTVTMFLGKLSEAFTIKALPFFTRMMQKATDYARVFVNFLMSHTHFVEGFMLAAAAAISYFLIPAAISGALAVWAMIAPFVLVGAAVLAAGAAFALLYDDVVNFLEGNESLIGNVLKRWPMLGEVLGDIVDVLKFAGGVLLDLGRIFAAVFGIAQDKVGGLIDGGLALLAQGLGKVGDALNPITSAFTAFGKIVGDVIQFLIDKVGAFLDRFGGVVGLAKTVAGAIRGALDSAKVAVGVDMAPRATAPGALPAATLAAVVQGRQTLGAAASSPLASATSHSISNTTRRGGDRNVTVEKVEVHTQATDAEGISRSVAGTLGTQLRKATSQFDDGVAA